MVMVMVMVMVMDGMGSDVVATDTGMPRAGTTGDEGAPRCHSDGALPVDVR